MIYAQSSARFVVKLFAVLLVLCGATQFAVAFENIEADAAYNGPIQDQIRKEFEAGILALNRQASSLKMEVREKDLETLSVHMWSKAVTHGFCFDRAISMQKVMNPKIDIKRVYEGCVDTHLKFADFLERKRAGIRLGFEKVKSDTVNRYEADEATTKFSHCSSMGSIGAWKDGGAPYDFLKIARSSTTSATNYVAAKLCYDKHPF